MVKEVEGDSPRSSSSHLLSLPPELILEIIAYLPLAAHLIFRLQVCRALRTNSHDVHSSSTSSSSRVNFSGDIDRAESSRRATLNLGPLKLTPPHRFSLSQWLAARQELQRLHLAGPNGDEDDEPGDVAEAAAMDEISGAQALTVPDLEAHRAGLTLQPAAFDWHKGAAAHSADPSTFPRPVAPRPRSQLPPRTHKVGVRDRRDAGPAHEARMLRRILGFLALVSPAEALPPDWTLPPWEAEMAEEAKRRKLDTAPRLGAGLAPWSGTGPDEGEHAAPRCVASQTALASSESSQSSAGSLRTLSLIGWSGISGEEVVALLRTCPALSDVKVVLKTDRLDNGPWEHLRGSAAGALQGAALSPQARVVRPPPPVPNEVPAAEEATASDSPAQPSAPLPSFATPFPARSYIETQVVVNVGSRVPPGAHLQIKGHGLSAGYRALCYSPSSSSSSSTPAEGASSTEQAGVGAAAAAAAAASLHVIFQGRFRLPDALEIEEMLAWSEVRCSACRAVLLF